MSEPAMPTCARLPVAFARGEGVWLMDTGRPANASPASLPRSRPSCRNRPRRS